MGQIDLLELSKGTLNQRTIISGTVGVYPPEWIVIHETLQNALDAIQKSQKKQGAVQIWLDLDNEEVRIKDNGVGFPFKLEYLGLGGTDKGSEDWTLGGNIGVGLKVVIFSTRRFELESVFDGQKWSCGGTDTFKYLMSEAEKVVLNYTEPAPSDEDTYTFLKYSFPESMVSDFIQSVYDDYEGLVPNELATSDLDKFKIGLEHYFRTRSYAGNVSRLLGVHGIKPVDITINIYCNQNITLNKIKKERLKQLLRSNPTISLNFTNKHWDISEAIARARRGVSTPAILNMDIPEGGLIGRYNQNYIYVKTLKTRQDLEKLLKNRHIRDPPDPLEYQHFFNQTSGIYLVVGSVPVIRKYLIEDTRHFLAASGIPSAHYLIKPSRGGYLGHLANIHFIADLKTKLNYGKQTISNPRLVGKASNFFTDAFRTTLKNVARSIVGEAPTPTTIQIPLYPPTEIISRRDIILPDLSIIKEPFNELEVIALFYELVGKGYLNEYRTYALSLRSQYDGKIMIKFPGQQDFALPNIDHEIPNIEFKHKVSSLIADFEEGSKRARDIALLIAWENDYRGTHVDYEVIDIVGTEIEDTSLEHVRTCLHERSSGQKIQLLILKEVIKELRKKI